MARLLLGDDSGWMTADIEVNGPVLGAALEQQDAEAMVRCAIMMTLSALVAGERWPSELMESMARFMSGMRQDVSRPQLM
jgi:hypothetical protein